MPETNSATKSATKAAPKPGAKPGARRRKKPKRNQPWAASRPVPTGWKRTRKGTIRKRSLTWRFRRIILLVGLVGIVAVSAGAYVIWNTTDIPSSVPKLPQTSFVCAADVTSNCNQDNSMAQLRGESGDRVVVKYEQIPGIFVQALVSAEDKDFFRHQGVDPTGVARALYANLKNEGVQQGGSTITQQYVKNVYLSSERTVDRKIKEAVLALKLDRELPKQEILERYLNTIYFGRGAYGIEAAARVYFGEHTEQLGLPESSYLAGLIRSPEAVDANRLPTDPLRDRQIAAATERRKEVLDTMLSEGYITKDAHDAVATMDFAYVLPRPLATENKGKVAHPELGSEYFLDYVEHWLTTNTHITESQIYGDGLRIYTTLDWTAQANAYDAIRSTLDRPDDPSASIVSIDDKGRVRAMVGGFDYKTSQVNLAVGADGGGSGRQPGSSFKPLVLAQYLKEGLSLGMHYDAPPKITLHTPLGTWTPANYGEYSEGNLDVVQATAVSSNTAYAQIEADTMKAAGNSIDPIIKMAHDLGVTADLPAVNSLVLGTGDVSVLDMASAYSTFADGGTHIPPYVVTKVTDSQGQVLYEAPTEGKPVITPTVAGEVSYALSQVVASGTGTGAAFGEPVAGKTGTTEDYHDAWFNGFSCHITTAVWVGYPLPDKNGHARYLQGVHGINVVGGTFPATIFSKYMRKATAGMTKCDGFPLPPGANFTPGGSYAPGTDVVGTSAPTTPGSTAPVTAPGSTAVTVPASSTTTTGASTTTTTQPASTTTSSSTVASSSTTSGVPTTPAPP